MPSPRPTREIIADLVAQKFRVERAKIRPNSRLVDFGVDSVRAMDLVVELEFQFGISISDRDIAAFTTLEDMARFVDAAKGG